MVFLGQRASSTISIIVEISKIGNRLAVQRLRLECQDRASGGAAIDQLDRMDTFPLASVQEEKQSGLWKRAVAFLHHRPLHMQFHGAAQFEGHLRGQGWWLAATTTAAGATGDAAFR